LLTITFASLYVTYVECRIIVRVSFATDCLIAMYTSGQMPQMHSRMHMHKCSGEIFLFFFANRARVHPHGVMQPERRTLETPDTLPTVWPQGNSA